MKKWFREEELQGNGGHIRYRKVLGDDGVCMTYGGKWGTYRVSVGLTSLFRCAGTTSLTSISLVSL